jgi:hypothetical protein
MATDAPVAHGFYYRQVDGRLRGLALPQTARTAMEAIWDGAFEVVPHEIYWRKLARYMITHAPQGYAAWNDVPHWIIGNCDRLLGTGGGDNGANIIQFHPDRTLTYQWFSLPDRGEDDDGPDAVYDLVYTPWDWLLEGQGDDEMFDLSKRQCDAIATAIGWTGELHAELEKRWPSEQHWT